MTPLAFSAFAERCEQLNQDRRDAGVKDNELLLTVARHARLLERIEELVSQVEGLEMNDDAYSRGFKKAHAEVLRLLREEGK